MSSPAPSNAPESDVGDLTLPTELPALSPGNDEITPPAPAITLPISVPSLFPPLVAPPLPIVVRGASPPPTSPILPPPTLSPTSQPQPQPQPQPQLQPPLASPPPITKNIPPSETPSPPNIISPPFSKPINLGSPPPTSSYPIIPPPPSPPAFSRRPVSRPTTQPSPSQPGPLRPRTAPATPRPASLLPTSAARPPSEPGPIRPKTTPATPRPASPLPASAARPPSEPGPLRPKTTPTPSPQSPLPTSAVLPSPPPVALPVPQSPGGGAWIPFSTESPAPLPILPGPPGTFSSPADSLHGSTNGALSSSSSDHQNIQAAALAPKGSNNGTSGFVVGLAVGGVLLLLLGVVFGILLVFCKRKGKKSGDYGSGREHATLFSGFKEKGSLPQYTKQGINNTQGLQSMINVSALKGQNIATSGTPPSIVGPTFGSGSTLSSGTFTYEELMRATHDFSEQNLLGQGGFGYVYKGVLPNGKKVAVKQLKMGGPQGEREFRAEVETISQVHHKHLVSLVGYCIAGPERLLIYEFVPNNTMEFHLHGNGQPVMDWPTRLKIAVGSAKGLAYLHEDCSPTIIHRDIKAANILLDFNFEAKVSDFGLAKIMSSTNPSVTHITTRVVGTFGYLAPEYASSGKVTDKSDVYSYGVMLLELISGHPPISNFESATSGGLVNWARPLLAQAIGDGNFDNLADPKLQNSYDVDEMTSMVACAAACVRLSAWRRPRMSQVVRALEGNLSASELDDGIRPGQSSMHFPYESLDFDAQNYMEDMKRMALTNNNGYTTTSRYSENTSEYGLHPSASSTNSSQPSRG